MGTTTIVGLGYVGLPLAVQAATKGYSVTGIDRNQKLVDAITERKSPFVNDDRFAAALRRIAPAAFSATTSFEAVSLARTVIICVPTPTEDNTPDLSFVENASTKIAQYMHPGQLIVLESTVNPGVTRNIVKPILEQKSSRVCGKDFYLAHCPERIDPGNTKFYVGNLNRVVGGITPVCTERAVHFYKSIIDADILPLASTEEAEFVKAWENSHRNVLIALANEAAVICDALGMDVSNILRGLQSKVDQFGLHLARPGIGPGGHCIPEDIHYVIRKARENGIDTRFLDTAADLNDHMPRYAVSRLQQLARMHGDTLGQLRVALLGVAYKENIADARRSPAIEVAQILAQRAKDLIMHDPYVNLDEVRVRGAEKTNDLVAALKGADALFIATPHEQYRALTVETLQEHNIRYILDGRNCLDKLSFQDTNIHYRGVGR